MKEGPLTQHLRWARLNAERTSAVNGNENSCGPQPSSSATTQPPPPLKHSTTPPGTSENECESLETPCATSPSAMSPTPLNLPIPPDNNLNSNHGTESESDSEWPMSDDDNTMETGALPAQITGIESSVMENSGSVQPAPEKARSQIRRLSDGVMNTATTPSTHSPPDRRTSSRIKRPLESRCGDAEPEPKAACMDGITDHYKAPPCTQHQHCNSVTPPPTTPNIASQLDDAILCIAYTLY